MERADVLRLAAFLEARISIDESTGAVRFDEPGADELLAAGLEPAVAATVRGAAWWDEMAAEVRETAEFCPGEPPADVLRFARDVVLEYLRKRG